MDAERAVDLITDLITDRPGRVVLASLVLTGVFAAGLGNISTEAGTEQFTAGVPAEEALEAVNREFSPSFAADTGSTQLIQSGRNVLSKPSLLGMLRTQERLAGTDGLRVTGTAGAARIVARTLDPTAATLDEQIDAVERATPTEIDAAVRTAAERDPSFAGLLSADFNREAASASATIGTVQHSVPTGLASGAGVGGSSPLTTIQTRAAHVAATVDGGAGIRVFGTGIFAAEFSNVIGDSLLLVIPAAVIFIVFFLVIAYRDLVDLLLGVIALGMAIVWTFGFMGLAGIPFSQFLIAVPPLLLAVGIDFGIHAINRYREERAAGHGIGDGMSRTADQLVVAFFIVTGTTVIGFAANFSSELGPIRDFGLVASIGILFTFLIFGIFLPALKVSVDRLGERYPVPSMSRRPLGSEGSPLGRALGGGVTVARIAPALFLVTVLVASAGAGVYATGIDTSFAQEDFLPPEDLPDYLLDLPEPFRPSEYTVVRDLNFLEEKFSASQQDSVTVYLQAPMERDAALETIHRAGRNPPGALVSEGRQADAESIVSVIESRAEADPEFRALVERSDRNDNGIPDDDLGEVYDALLSSPARSSALSYITEDRRSARIVYAVESEAPQDEIVADGREVAGRYRFRAIATGSTVVFQVISDIILRSAAVSLSIALVGAAGFLVLVYYLLEGRASLGIANLVPIVVTVAALAGTMRALGISFNAFTATILAITIGLGIDYSVHVTHRFADEFREREAVPALLRTLRGTGGALTGSMLTTVFGIGVLVLAIFPAIGQFGLLTAVSILYSYLSSLLVLPSVLYLWARLAGPSGDTFPDGTPG